ncbi:phosphatidylserine decarboxylase [Bacillus dakarensis]|uniref:phosphatidylserine decarboxylase n=1 Tax=Robertmurraya dakarensis TaxID=1926278 RepID=UPI0009809DB2|nr:phosphatidylserine decarboxylase [Bacillus dakarensis]
MFQYIYRFLIELTNKRWTSALLQKFSTSSISRILIPSFARIYKVNLQEAELSINDFPNLHQFFIRKLKAGSRPINQEPESVVSPVDAVLEEDGEITAELSVIIKDKPYSLIDMLGSQEKAKKYINGTYVLLYLSPSHYHRIHSPFGGRVIDQWTLGNTSYPVNKYGIKYGRETLSKNFRKITEVEHEFGYGAIVKVGAMFVNSIETIYESEVIEKGEEIAYFSFGSTVILLFEEGFFEKLADLHAPADVKVGEVIGYLKYKGEKG